MSEPKEIDWEQRRYEIASQLFIHRVLNARRCIDAADRLIAGLKGEPLPDLPRKSDESEEELPF